jgi:hypothetical protein
MLRTARGDMSTCCRFTSEVGLRPKHTAKYLRLGEMAIKLTVVIVKHGS